MSGQWCITDLKLDIMGVLFKNVTDDTVANIADQCSKIEFLSLSNCKEITDNALQSIAHGCQKIRFFIIIIKRF
jgi:hypothetical protein